MEADVVAVNGDVFHGRRLLPCCTLSQLGDAIPGGKIQMIDIVVNYRTSDEPLAALLLDQALVKRLGEDRVFRDHRTIGAGKKYPTEIWAAIAECKILIAVIGGRWLDPDHASRRRIDDPTDYVRREIAEALRRDIRVVPVLVGEATLPTPDELPPDLRELPLRQFRTLRFRGAEDELDRIADELVGLLRGVVPAPGDHDAAAATAVTNHFHGDVHAPRGVFGIANNYNR
jgi:TIR domain